MTSGNLRLVADGDALTLERPASDPAEFATRDFETHDDAFAVQQQRIQRLTKYYDDVVAELLTLLNQSDEGEEEAGLALEASALP
jgi:nitrate reductase assembly molybdenum cofactor insertion protein NarJ